MSVYYNEIDSFAAAWLRELMKAGQIPDGEVDERSIEDVRPDDLRGFHQCHFFAGLGGWALALRLAGWPIDRAVWTGSCPCQPFSAAGKGDGFADERHLWPAFFHLIEQRSPVVVFGEQVASKDGYGWLDLVQVDLEDLAYACGPVVLPTAGFGGPHERHRIYFVADAVGERHARQRLQLQPREPRLDLVETVRSCETSAVADAESRRFGVDGSASRCAGHTDECEPLSRMGDTDDARSQGWEQRRHGPDQRLTRASGVAGILRGFWADAEWISCSDGFWRAVEPGTFPLASGVPARVGRLRGYGNAVCVPVAQAFIEAYLSIDG